MGYRLLIAVSSFDSNNRTRLAVRLRLTFFFSLPRYCNLNLFCPRYSYATEGGRSFTVRSIRDWNSLPRSLRVLDSDSRFKTSLLKKFLVTQKKDFRF